MRVTPFHPGQRWYRLARDHGLTRAVVAASARALLDVWRRAAPERGVRWGRTGTLTVTQRFGSTLNVPSRSTKAPSPDYA